ncbi:MAG: hypothetical protein RLZZ324_213 [Candidatus Parcubacteria bacterium]|jgi:small subunit ribosomal protein S17
MKKTEKKSTPKAAKAKVTAPVATAKVSQPKVFQGEVVAAGKMAKTITVQVDRTRMNEKYSKRYGLSSTFHVHDEKGEFKTGDTVRFVETRPYSRTKRWRATGKVTKA